MLVELGPGSSYGLGFCALLCGAKRYYGIDYIDHTTDARNQQVFDQLVQLFKERAPVPLQGFCARIFPFIDDDSFPVQQLPDSLLNRTLDETRLATIRSDLVSRGSTFIRVRPSPELGNVSLEEPADVIISESVLEHVDDLKSTYGALARWLRPNGAMVHLIDYSSHNLSNQWNGHWQCSPFLWSVVRGRRQYLINRMPHQGHLDLLEANGLKVVGADLLRRVDGLTREQFSPEFRNMSYRDSTIALAAVTAMRAA